MSQIDVIINIRASKYLHYKQRMVLCRYHGFNLVSGEKTFVFYKQHFYELIKGLATEDKYGQKVAYKLIEGQDFNIGDIIVKYTPKGCIWKSHRRTTHKTSGQVIRLTNNHITDLCRLLRNEPFDKYNLGIYLKTKGTKKLRRVRYRNRYTFFFCFLFDIRIPYDFIYPIVFLRTYRQKRNNKIPIKRQSHGIKTISNHYIKCLENIERLTEEPP